MKKLIIAVIVLVLAICLGLLLQKNPGYMLIAYNNWTIETSLWFGVIVIIVAFLIIYYFLWFVNFLFSSHGNILRWVKQRRFVKAHSVTGGGLLALHQADWENAERLLLRGVKSSSIPVVNYLGAAKAAHAKENFKKRDSYLQHAEKNADDKQGKMAILLTKANLLLDHKDYQEASLVLERVAIANAKHPLLLKLRYKLFQETAAWGKLIELIPLLRKKKLIEEPELSQAEITAHKNILLQDGINKTELENCWHHVPRSLRKNTDLVKCYAKHLHQVNADELAAPVIEDSLKAHFTESLVVLYGGLHLTNWQKQLKRVQNWAAKQGDSVCLLNTMAKLYSRANQQTNAIDCAQRSLDIKENKEAYLLLAKSYDAVGNHHNAQVALNKALAE